jgi:hypothetical protein
VLRRILGCKREVITGGLVVGAQEMNVWTVCIWLRIGTSGGLNKVMNLQVAKKSGNFLTS